jgi:hypothetical protein
MGGGSGRMDDDDGRRREHASLKRRGHVVGRTVVPTDPSVAQLLYTYARHARAHAWMHRCVGACGTASQRAGAHVIVDRLIDELFILGII